MFGVVCFRVWFVVRRCGSLCVVCCVLVCCFFCLLDVFGVCCHVCVIVCRVLVIRSVLFCLPFVVALCLLCAVCLLCLSFVVRCNRFVDSCVLIVV